MAHGTSLRQLIERFTGHPSPVAHCFLDDLVEEQFWATHRVGHSQLNEMLLALAYETLSEALFRHVFGGDPTTGLVRDEFIAGVERFEQLALLKYGNVKFAFKTLAARSENELDEELRSVRPVPMEVYTHRPPTLRSVEEIDPAETYYLGHITGEAVARSEDGGRKRRMSECRRIGEANLNIYLCSDELDVYVATSMRDVEDFYFVGTAVKRLFAKPELAPLNLRYFDPTQSFCASRIEKGLVESLMLRRAKCTVYCAQTTETLGKDSELAVTLAMGKPVVVYAPQIRGNEAEYRALCEQTASLHASVFRCSTGDYYRTKLVERHAKALGRDLSAIGDWSLEQLEKRLLDLDDALFERKATVLRDAHPLGIQVDLNTGVANGVLVARTLTDCALLLRDILTNTMQFRTERDVDGTLRLVEKRTGCTFRLMVSDATLTNSFWNFYRPWLHRPD